MRCEKCDWDGDVYNFAVHRNLNSRVCVIFVSSLYWEQSAGTVTEEQKDQLKSSHKSEGKRPFVTNLLWVDVKV